MQRERKHLNSEWKDESEWFSETSTHQLRNITGQDDNGDLHVFQTKECEIRNHERELSFFVLLIIAFFSLKIIIVSYSTGVQLVRVTEAEKIV